MGRGIRRARHGRPARSRKRRRHVAARCGHGADRRRQARARRSRRRPPPSPAGKPPWSAERSTAATTATRRARAASIRRAMSRSGGPPRLRLMTCAPFSSAALSPRARARVVQDGAGARRLAAGAQRQHASVRRDAGDADPVVGPRRDDAGHRGAVVLAEVGPIAGEVQAGVDLLGEVGMVELHAAVDHRDPDIAAGRRRMQLGEVPARRGRLHARTGDRRGRSVRNRFIGCAHSTCGSWPSCAGDLVGPARGGNLHHVAIEADDRHRPGRGQDEAVGACQRLRHPASRRPAAGIGVAAGVVAVGAEVGGGEAKEHQDLLRRIDAAARSPRGPARPRRSAVANPQSAAARISAFIAPARLRAIRPGRPRARPAGGPASLAPTSGRRSSQASVTVGPPTMRASAARSAWRMALSVASGRKTTSAFAVVALAADPRVRYSAGSRRSQPGRRQDQHEHGLQAEGERQPAHSPSRSRPLPAGCPRRGFASRRARRASQPRSAAPAGTAAGSGLQVALELDVGLAARAFAEMRLEPGPLLGIEGGVGVPRQQDLRRPVLVAVEMEDPGLHSQSSGSPESSARSRRRPWKQRVFTVSTGQPTITRDLGIRQVVEVGQDEDAALLVREAVERPRQCGPGLFGGAMLLRPGAGARRGDRASGSSTGSSWPRRAFSAVR